MRTKKSIDGSTTIHLSGGVRRYHVINNVRSPFHRFWRYLSLGSFVVAAFCLCFAYGVAVGKWHLFPYRFLDMGLDSLRRLQNPTPHFIHRAKYEGEGVVIYEPQQVFPGVTLIAGPWKDMDGQNVGIRLIDMRGNILHQWRINVKDIRELDKVMYDEPYVHGALLLPGGDVIFNLEYTILVRMNAQSEVVWKLKYPTHHSVFQEYDGSIWVCGVKWHGYPIEEFPGLKPPFWEDTILKVSLDGVIEREISMLRIIYESGYYNLLFATNQRTGDILHLNDVEVLNQQKACAFDLFEAGDIMISMRHINTIFVIDGETERIKWSLTHPFIAQHDPDFTEDGYITVFDNHLDILGGSRILRIEPSTREVETLYGHKEHQDFFTLRCGKHQHLPNGNMLITESWTGRVFEVTKNSEVVWSWITPKWDKHNVAEILGGTRYSIEYAGFVNGLSEGIK
jgi:hypothetical protein